MSEHRDFRAAELVGVFLGMLAAFQWVESDPSFLLRGSAAVAGGLVAGWLVRLLGVRGYTLSNIVAGALVLAMAMIGVAAAYVVGDLAWREEIPVMLGILGFWALGGSALLFLMLARGEEQGPRFRMISAGLLLGGFLSHM
jgi:NO-binding membrane sensor protein with MHYT domain